MSAPSVARALAAASVTDEILAHALERLGARPRVLSPKYFYDDAGAALFELICKLDAYYLTRTEAEIHRRYAREIADAIGPSACLIEFGSGNGVKTRRLLPSLIRPTSYVPVDICRPQLLSLAAAVRREFPKLAVWPVWADFSSTVELPAERGGAARTVALYHGSTIGNFLPDDAVAFLRAVAARCGAGAGMLVGVDLVKESAVIDRAYNDPEGITAQFNLNLLRRLNRECGANFALDGFRHEAIYDDDASRVEMRLVSVRNQVVSIPVRTGSSKSVRVRFRFLAGEWLTTEYSYKYTVRSFEEVARRGGWGVDCYWTDRRGWFGVWLLRSMAS